MFEVGAKFSPILLFDSKRREDCHDSPQDDGINVIPLRPLLLGERLGYNGPDVFITKLAHRLMILATFSKPRLPDESNLIKIRQACFGKAKPPGQ